MIPTVEKQEKGGIVVSSMSKSAPEARLPKLLAKAKKHLYPNYAQPELVMDRGEGSYLYLSTGEKDQMITIKEAGDSLALEDSVIELALPRASCHLFDATGRAFPRVEAEKPKS